MEAMKILSISNNLLSLNNANGKFCRNYLHSFRDDELASFYISNDIKSENEKIDSFNYSDADVLRDFLHKKHTIESNQEYGKKEKIVNRQSAFVRIIRYFIWKIVFRKNVDFNKWIENIKPTHIVITVGDNPYLFLLARKLKKRFNSKLIIICGENYSLKKYNYLKCKYHRNLSFLWFQNILRRNTRKTFKESNLVIFNSNSIKDLYEKKMKFQKSIVVYPLSANRYIDAYDPLNKDIVYAGNLGVGRAEAIVNFSNILNDVDNNHKLVVYGKATKEQIELLKKGSNIEYKGIVTNDELIGIVNRSWLLLHVESFDEYRKIDLEYAFSTKLSDLISSNDRFFMFAPDCYVESKFFIRYLRTHIALNENELTNVLSELLMQKKPFSFDDNSQLRATMDINKNGKYIRDLISNL